MRSYFVLLGVLLLSCCSYSPKDSKIMETNSNGVSTDDNDQCIFQTKENKNIVYSEICSKRIPISSDELKVIIVNNTHNAIEYGTTYYIEERKFDKWNRISFDRDTCGNIIAFNLIGFSLEPHSYTRKKYGLMKNAHRYSIGEYRIVIPYTQNKVKMEISSEFSIVENNQKQEY